MGEADQRALWREARQHISEYESKASELALDLQAEQKALSLAREQLAAMQRETAEHDRLRIDYERKAMAEHRLITDLSCARESEVADTQRLAQQLAAASAAYEEERKKQADMKQHFAEHLRSLEEHLSMLQRHAQGQPAEASSQHKPQQEADAADKAS